VIITLRGGTPFELSVDCGGTGGGGSGNGDVTADLSGAGLSANRFTISVDPSQSTGKVGVRAAAITVIPRPPAILGVVSAFALAFGVKRATRRSDV
jgi:hypothetical protein